MRQFAHAGAEQNGAQEEADEKSNVDDAHAALRFAFITVLHLGSGYAMLAARKQPPSPLRDIKGFQDVRRGQASLLPPRESIVETPGGGKLRMKRCSCYAASATDGRETRGMWSVTYLWHD